MPKCSECDKPISETEAITYNGKCKKCYTKDDTEELEEGLMFLEELS